MLDLKQIVIPVHFRIRDAMKRLEDIFGTFDTLFIVDKERRLIGALTDSDIRRALIHDDISNNDSVSRVAQLSPKIIVAGTIPLRGTLEELKKYRFLPVVNEQKVLLGFEKITDLLSYPNRVVLMAGGQGNRLRPLTEKIPKPMLNVGNKPILQTIIEQFRDNNFINFTISLNYQAEIIKDYFKDGSAFDTHIEYVHEGKKLGTAGSLSLIESIPVNPVFVMNADILTNVNFHDMLDLHTEKKYEITMGVIEHSVNIPYGVVESSNGYVIDIIEKPKRIFFVNAGIYILNPNIITEIPKSEYFDMPTLIKNMTAQGRPVGIYFLQDYWMDIGHPDDFEKANNDYVQYFGCSRKIHTP